MFLAEAAPSVTEVLNSVALPVTIQQMEDCHFVTWLCVFEEELQVEVSQSFHLRLREDRFPVIHVYPLRDHLAKRLAEGTHLPRPET